MSLNLGSIITKQTYSIEETIFDCIDLEERIDSFCNSITTMENVSIICNLTENKSQEIVNFAEELLGCSIESIKAKVLKTKDGSITSDRDEWLKNDESLRREIQPMLFRLKNKFQSLRNEFEKLDEKNPNMKFNITPAISKQFASFTKKGFRVNESGSDAAFNMAISRKAITYHDVARLAKAGYNACEQMESTLIKLPSYVAGKQNWNHVKNIKYINTTNTNIQQQGYKRTTYLTRELLRHKRNITNLRKLLAALLLIKRQYAVKKETKQFE